MRSPQTAILRRGPGRWNPSILTHSGPGANRCIGGPSGKQAASDVLGMTSKAAWWHGREISGLPPFHDAASGRQPGTHSKLPKDCAR